jgi:predicted glycosyltransferase
VAVVLEGVGSRAGRLRSAKPRLTFYVQHLLGIGHLVRAVRIVRALADSAFDVALVIGGGYPAGIDTGRAEVVTLPPVKAGQNGFSTLVHPDGRAFDEAAQAYRRALLLDHFDRFAPDILVVEAFPFGRRQMRFELLPLLERAKTRPDPPLIAASVRDILQENRRPERVIETLDVVERYFDLILVHGDPRLVTLDRSFPAASGLADKISYTGIVAPSASDASPGASGSFAAIVSVGGGAVGAALLRVALAARALTSLREEPWLLLTGPNLPAEIGENLGRNPDDGVVVAPFIPDLATALRGAKISISQAGYNTVADVLVAGCRSVLIPFAAGGETEQSARAALLQDLDLAVSVPEADLTASTLAAAIERALTKPQPGRGLDLKGAQNTVSILSHYISSRL